MNEEAFSVTREMRRLRDRSGLSRDILASKMGYAGGSALQRYEDPHLYKKPYLPIDIVERLAKHLVGLGKPPITEDEVFALAGPPVSFDIDDEVLKTAILDAIRYMASVNVRAEEDPDRFTDVVSIQYRLRRREKLDVHD